LQCNPSHSWETTIPGAAVVRAYRVVGRLLRVRVVKRDGHGAYGGRAVEVLIKGTKGSITVTGDQFAIALNLHSNWFAIAAVRRA
jgi:peptidoglycan hydrolase-like amidase